MNTSEGSDIDKAIKILERTKDGDELDPKLLGLVELAVNGNLNNVGKDAFEGLYPSCSDISPMIGRTKYIYI